MNAPVSCAPPRDLILQCLQDVRMAQRFITQLVVDAITHDKTVRQFIVTQLAADVQTYLEGRLGDYLPLSGNVSMTGYFNLAGDATAPLQPVAYEQLQQYIPLAGNPTRAMDGPLILVGPATQPNQAVTLSQLLASLTTSNIAVNPSIMGATNLQDLLDALAGQAALSMTQFVDDLTGAYTPSTLAGATITIIGDAAGTASGGTADAITLSGDAVSS